ncbi:hypothetical protein [Rhizobium halophytocola]|uniref:EF-hand domain-containing protein n=1 Tax=Rhizobium halophytocola TaxID=735519 RepID=A0ABS4DZR2_9HYPH|nr:hypothetical protein [Rhizobium halophytocola]MBP1851186.1 hypothetical protein [Rhizobium halophytocola]
MDIAVSTTSAAAGSSTSGSGTSLAQLKSQLAAKQAELSKAETDADKEAISKEITTLKASITKAEASAGDSGTQQSVSSPGAADGGKTVAVTSADRAAPAARLSSGASEVLMQMRPGGAKPPQGGEEPDFSTLYSELDSDQDGRLTKAEFAAGAKAEGDADYASALFDALDSDGTGGLSLDQFTEGLRQDGPGGRDGAGGPDGRGEGWTSR